MKVGHRFKYLLAATLTGGLVALLYAGVSKAEPPYRANIGFGTATTDADILKMMQRYGVEPQAVYMWTSGLAGTHRAYKTQDARIFLQEARDQTIDSFEKGLEGNLVRLRRFAKMHAEEEIVASDDLQSEVRSLLNIRSKLEAGLTAAKNGDPLIVSMEVSGPQANVERLQMDKLVKAFEGSREIDGKAVVPHTPMPEAYQKEWVDPGIQAMTAQELYGRIKALLAAN